MIHFHTQDFAYILKNKNRLKNWINNRIKKAKREPGNINFIFCSDAHLLIINEQYLNHATYTDIITFDYSKTDPKLPVSGDIFISAERVAENAEKFGKTPENEMHRVMIHGVLHLLGYTDKTKMAKTKMTKEEDACLKTLATM